MSKQAKHDELDNVNEALSRSEQFIQEYQKPIFIGVLIVIIAASIYLSVRHFYILPREAKAQAEMFRGTFYFEKDSFQLALNGNGADFVGFEAIAKEHSSTAAGNLAQAYAGLCYMHLGQYENAVKHLKEFDASDILVSPAILGAIGDCYIEMDKTNEGIEYFEKAAGKAENELISPIYLKKAGIAYESLKNYDKAIAAYQQIKDKYPSSMEGADIEKYIVRAEALKK